MVFSERANILKVQQHCVWPDCACVCRILRCKCVCMGPCVPYEGWIFGFSEGRRTTSHISIAMTVLRINHQGVKLLKAIFGQFSLALLVASCIMGVFELLCGVIYFPALC